MKRCYQFCLCWCMATLLAFSASAKIYYVNANASGSNNGTSWPNAFTSLQSALDLAQAYDYIFVAAGTYKPSKDILGNASPANTRTKTFLIRNGVRLFGGFAGYEVSPDMRNPAVNQTILSGDLNGDDAPNFVYRYDNVYHVVAAGNINTETILDGFIVRGGYANQSDDFNGVRWGNLYGGGLIASQATAQFKVTRCVFKDSYAIMGGGAMHHATSDATITACVFTGNGAANAGGAAISLSLAANAITNCVFTGNISAQWGGAVRTSNYANPVITNSTFTGNHAGNTGGAIYCENNTSITLRNSVIWGNTGGGTTSIHKETGAVTTVTYSDIEGGYTGDGNIDVAPAFIAMNDADGADSVWYTADDGLILSTSSPAANAGSNAAIPAGITTDILGDNRVLNTTVNMGAYEALVSTAILYVNAAASGDNSGTSWSNAFTSLQSALDIATSGQQVWVAAGIYKPSKDITGNASPTDARTRTFLVRNGVRLYGGFGGTESTLSQRKTLADVTILSGDFNDNDTHGYVNYTENAYHVVAFSNVTTATVLDGFTVTAGNADSYTDFLGVDSGNTTGGGFFADEASANLMISKCIFRDNLAKRFGGAMHHNHSDATIVDCIFSGNRTTSVYGGGMALIQSSPRIHNCVFHDNSSILQGSALYIETASPIISSCTFTANYTHTLENGPAIYCAGASAPAIRNSIIWNNGTNAPIVTHSGSTIVVNYSDVQGGYPGVGNIDADPLFSDTTDVKGPEGRWRTGDDGLALRKHSPAANAGSNALVPSDILTDVIGDDRILNARVNMGAYEALRPSAFYVNASATGLNNGSSWTNAFVNLQSALDIASVDDQVLVAAGTYRPSKDISGNAAPADLRTRTFLLKNGVKLYGGFEGNASVPNSRDVLLYPTILSGDLNGDDSMSAANRVENAHHVVTVNALDTRTELDGFTITAGNAASSADFLGVANGHMKGGGLFLRLVSNHLVVSRCIFKNNHAESGGGGMLHSKSDATITDCIITENTGGGFSGGAFIVESSPVITNCVFNGNTTTGEGGAMNIFFLSYPVISNCTFSNNQAANNGGAVANSYSGSIFQNTIFWGNAVLWNSAGEKSIVNDSGTGTVTVTYSDVEGGYPGEGNIDADPLFTNMADPDGADDLWSTADDGLTLGAGSPAANAGNNAVIPYNLTRDLTGNDRIINATVDMGAYERLPLKAIITLADTYATCDGAPKGISVVTEPAGLNTVITYEKDRQEVAAPVTAGEYQVTVTIDDPEYTGEATGVFAIGKAAATVAVSNFNYIYDGLEKSAQVTTTPANLAVTFLYSKDTGEGVIAPVDAGTYDVIATVQDDCYQGSGFGTLVINKALALLKISGLSQQYDGSVKAVTVTSVPPGLTGINVTYLQGGVAVSPIAAGSYNVLATLTHPNYHSRLERGTLVITPSTQYPGSTIKAYPNPVNDYIVIEGTVDLPENSFSMSDAFGQPVRITVAPLQQGSGYRLDVRHLKAGLYYLRIKTGDGIITQHLIKN